MNTEYLPVNAPATYNITHAQLFRNTASDYVLVYSQSNSYGQSATMNTAYMKHASDWASLITASASVISGNDNIKYPSSSTGDYRFNTIYAAQSPDGKVFFAYEDVNGYTHLAYISGGYLKPSNWQAQVAELDGLSCINNMAYVSTHDISSKIAKVFEVPIP
jgi:hypothetical protein